MTQNPHGTCDRCTQLEAELATLKKHHALTHGGCQSLRGPSATSQPYRRRRPSLSETDKIITLPSPRALLGLVGTESVRHEPIEILFETGCDPLPQPKRRKHDSGDLHLLRDLYEKIPASAQSWKKTLQGCGFYESDRSCPRFPACLNITAYEAGSQSLTLEDRVTLHAKRVVALAGRRTTAFAMFYEFLVLSACLVLLKIDGSLQSKVYKIAKTVLGNEDMSDDYCRQLLRTAQHMNEMLACLGTRGFGFHGSELLFIWGKSVRYYYPLSRARGSRQTSLASLRSDHFPLPDLREGDEYRTVSLFVPALVSKMLNRDGAESLSSFSNALGYKQYLVKGRVDPWNYFQNRPESWIRFACVGSKHPVLDGVPRTPHPCAGPLIGDILELAEFASQALPREIYTKNAEVPFMFEILESQGWNEKLRPFLVAWINDNENFRQLEEGLRRKARPVQDRQKLLGTWAFIRFKEMRAADWQHVLEDPSPASTSEAVVFIALQDLRPDNGFFLNLQRGYWICMDRRGSIRLPPTGGGIGIYVKIYI